MWIVNKFKWSFSFFIVFNENISLLYNPLHMQYLFSHYVILKPYLQEDDQFGFESLSCIVKITISKKNPVIEILLLFQNKFKHT